MPSNRINIIKKHIPVFGSWEEDDDINSLYDKVLNNIESIDDFIFHIPTCSHCKYCYNINDDSDAILGYSTGTDLNCCVFPVEKNNFIKEIKMEFDLEYEKIRGYRENNEGIIKNAFTNIILSEMKLVNRHTRDLEGKVSSPFNQYFGPICPEFELCSESYDLEDNGGPYRIVGDIDITFGLPNVEAIENEKKEKEKRDKIKSVIKKAQILIENDPEAKKIFKTRIEMNNIDRSEEQSLVQYLAFRFSVDELEIVRDNEIFPIFTSHRAYREIIQKSIDTILSNYIIELVSDR